jgi:hypothetical protein
LHVRQRSVNALVGSDNTSRPHANAAERSDGEVAEGPQPSNRGPLNSISKQFIPLLLGVDSLYLSFPGDLSGKMEAELERLKLLGQSESEKEQAQAQLKIGEHLFEVLGNGAPRFPFILADNCFFIKFSRHRAKSLPMASVQISSEYLAAVGVEVATANLCNIIEQFGDVHGIPKISRVDVFLDFICPVDFDGLKQECWITRANLLAKYYDRRIPQPFTGWVVGIGGDLSSRLYEKTVEIEHKSRKFFFHDLWNLHGWKLGNKVWRQEFQLRRELLKQLQINTVPDLLRLKDELWRYLTEDWLRLAIPNPNDDTRTRWPTHPIWLAISKAYSITSGQPRLKRFHPQRLPRDDWMLVNGLGGLTSFMASQGIEDFGEGLGEYLHQAQHFHKVNGGDFFKYISSKVRSKSRKYNTLDNTREQ